MKSGGRFRVFVDGESDARALPILLERLDAELGVSEAEWDPAVMHYKDSRDFDMVAKLTRNDAIGGALMLFDGDSPGTSCAATDGPRLSKVAAGHAFPFPVAVVIAVQELEAWFLPCISCLAGASAEDRRGFTTQMFRSDALSPAEPETFRDCKRALRLAMPAGRGYKEILDAPVLARAIHLDHVRDGHGGAGGSRSFLTMVRAHRFLRTGSAFARTYPPF
jgi:Domain of unknown function (DUF4276)